VLLNFFEVLETLLEVFIELGFDVLSDRFETDTDLLFQGLKFGFQSLRRLKKPALELLAALRQASVDSLLVFEHVFAQAFQNRVPDFGADPGIALREIQKRLLDGLGHLVLELILELASELLVKKQESRHNSSQQR
jgi:hypothetical protein